MQIKFFILLRIFIKYVIFNTCMLHQPQQSFLTRILMWKKNWIFIVLTTKFIEIWSYVLLFILYFQTKKQKKHTAVTKKDKKVLIQACISYCHQNKRYEWHVHHHQHCQWKKKKYWNRHCFNKFRFYFVWLNIFHRVCLP